MQSPTSPSRSYEQYRHGKSSPLQSLFDWIRTDQDALLLEFVKEHPSFLELQDSRGYGLLMMATYHGKISLTRELLALGASANLCDFGGNSPLMGAAFKGHYEVVEILLQAGAQVHLHNKGGQTALQFADMFGRREVSRLLRSHSSSEKHSADKGSLFRGVQSWFQFLKQKAALPLKETV